jgi:predicted TIM-barrel fold metal-dependent hydrolase
MLSPAIFVRIAGRQIRHERSNRETRWILSMTKPIRIVDSHQHVFWWRRDDAGLIADMDAHGIEYAWLLSWELPREDDRQSYHAAPNPLHFRADGTHRGIPLEDLLRARDHYPDGFVVGYCPTPNHDTAVERFRAAVEMYDLKVCGEWKFKVPFDDPRCIRIYRAAGELGMPVVLHLDVPFRHDENGQDTYMPAWYGGTVDNLERALLACPDTNFIGHAPGFWREISGDARTDPDVYPRGPIVGRGKLYCRPARPCSP